MNWVDVLQIILIPIFTILLAGQLEKNKETRLRRLSKDKEKFDKIHLFFVQNNHLDDFFRYDSVGANFRSEKISQIDELKRLVDEPGFIFTDKELEKLRIEFVNKIKSFLSKTSKHLTVHETSRNFYQLIQKRIFYESGNPEDEKRMNELITEIDDIGTQVFEIYKQLSELAQKKL